MNAILTRRTGISCFMRVRGIRQHAAACPMQFLYGNGSHCVIYHSAMLQNRLRGCLATGWGLALLVVFLRSLIPERSGRQPCETTYIWEGYEEIRLPDGIREQYPAYQLFRWADANPQIRQGMSLSMLCHSPLQQQLPSYAPFTLTLPLHGNFNPAVQQQMLSYQVAVVLFVHGHGGTYQQLRSMAAESGRELTSRLRANSSWRVWMEWYGVNMHEEPSGLEARLVVSELASSACVAQVHPPTPHMQRLGVFTNKWHGHGGVALML